MIITPKMADTNSLSKEERIDEIKALIRAIPDFPKKGILFRDIFPLTRDPIAFSSCLALMSDHVRAACTAAGATDIAIVGLDARGFIFGPIIALHLNAPFVPIRKAGKLPGETVQASYKLEYGTDVFEVQKDALKPGQSVIVVDDLLATGGTMRAACELMKTVECNVIECLVLIELSDLNGRKNVPAKVHSLLQYGPDE